MTNELFIKSYLSAKKKIDKKESAMKFVAQKYDISYSGIKIMFSLLNHDRFVDIVEHSGLDKGFVSRTIDNLSDKKVIKVIRTEKTKRVKSIVPNAKTKKILSEVVKCYEKNM